MSVELVLNLFWDLYATFSLLVYSGACLVPMLSVVMLDSLGSMEFSVRSFMEGLANICNWSGWSHKCCIEDASRNVKLPTCVSLCAIFLVSLIMQSLG